LLLVVAAGTAPHIARHLVLREYRTGLQDHHVGTLLLQSGGTLQLREAFAPFGGLPTYGLLEPALPNDTPAWAPIPVTLRTGLWACYLSALEQLPLQVRTERSSGFATALASQPLQAEFEKSTQWLIGYEAGLFFRAYGKELDWR
jgi:hypothetical protein